MKSAKGKRGDPAALFVPRPSSDGVLTPYNWFARGSIDRASDFPLRATSDVNHDPEACALFAEQPLGICTLLADEDHSLRGR